MCGRSIRSLGCIRGAATLARICPNCQHRIAWSEINSRFKCPKCDTPLRSNVNSVFVWLTILSLLPFAVVVALPGLYAAAGFVGGLLACAVFVNFATDVERDGENAT